MMAARMLLILITMGSVPLVASSCSPETGGSACSARSLSSAVTPVTSFSDGSPLPRLAGVLDGPVPHGHEVTGDASQPAKRTVLDCDDGEQRDIFVLLVMSSSLQSALGGDAQRHVRGMFEHAQTVYEAGDQTPPGFRCKLRPRLAGVLDFGNGCDAPPALVERPCNTPDPAVANALPVTHACCQLPRGASCNLPGPYHCLRSFQVAGAQSQAACFNVAQEFVYWEDEFVWYLDVTGVTSTSAAETDFTRLYRGVNEWFYGNGAALRATFGTIHTAAVITDSDFAGKTLGLAGNGQLCSEQFGAFVVSLSASLYSLRNPCSANPTDRWAAGGNIIAHELGHLLGASHDAANECTGDDTPVMCATASLSPLSRFSTETGTAVNFWFDNKYGVSVLKCLQETYNAAAAASAAAAGEDGFAVICGDGVVSGCEECDPGIGQFANDPCCDPATCQLKEGCACSTCLPCCAAGGLGVQPAGTVCRPQTDPECDPAETCDGAHAACPRDAWAAQGHVCGGAAKCYDGECVDWNGLCARNFGDPGALFCQPPFALSPTDRCDALFCTLSSGVVCEGLAGKSVLFEGKSCGSDSAATQCRCGACVPSVQLARVTWHKGPCALNQRTVECVDETNRPVADGLCDAATRPSSTCCAPDRTGAPTPQPTPMPPTPSPTDVPPTPEPMPTAAPTDAIAPTSAPTDRPCGYQAVCRGCASMAHCQWCQFASPIQNFDGLCVSRDSTESCTGIAGARLVAPTADCPATAAPQPGPAPTVTDPMVTRSPTVGPTNEAPSPTTTPPQPTATQGSPTARPSLAPPQPTPRPTPLPPAPTGGPAGAPATPNGTPAFAASVFGPIAALGGLPGWALIAAGVLIVCCCVFLAYFMVCRSVGGKDDDDERWRHRGMEMAGTTRSGRPAPLSTGRSSRARKPSMEGLRQVSARLFSERGPRVAALDSSLQGERSPRSDFPRPVARGASSRRTAGSTSGRLTRNVSVRRGPSSDAPAALESSRGTSTGDSPRAAGRPAMTRGRSSRRGPSASATSVDGDRPALINRRPPSRRR